MKICLFSLLHPFFARFVLASSSSSEREGCFGELPIQSGHHSATGECYQSDTASASSQWHHYALDNPDSFDQKYYRDTLHMDENAPVEQAQSWYQNPTEYRIYYTIGNHHATPIPHGYAQHVLDPSKDAARPRERREANLATDVDTYELTLHNSRIKTKALRHIARLDRDHIGEYKGAVYLPQRFQVYFNPLLADNVIVERFHSPNGPRMPSLIEDPETGRLSLVHTREYDRSVRRRLDRPSNENRRRDPARSGQHE